MTGTVLVAGSHGTIGRALIKSLSDKGYRVVTVSRKAEKLAESDNHLAVELTEESSVALVGQWLKDNLIELDGVICCCGQLHQDGNLPEKNLKQLNQAWLAKSMSVNVVTHMHLAQSVAPFIKSKSRLRWLSVSAKVGSIEDNQLGGWYSYRMSKSALNMLVKNLSIEWQRKASGTSVIAVHPGTTPSALSEPFTKNWPKDKLYPDDVTANRITTIFESLTPDGSGKLYHHDGTEIPW
ncbi:SDR family NAD(P)-dependent oxidoreductase [Veronia pacifica]|uniref:Cell-cell signaling protein CsgA n=1 Tax=Veronia pacifica TaxID=1080227 RepID=A0A1C3EQY9_9GAMM|nr:SDR family NAD(P)-dependent oxidoreductase [Veronia pacifica]ODA35647.1 cell-cell signaling protein CsgA [Veronia pacifica]